MRSTRLWLTDQPSALSRAVKVGEGAAEGVANEIRKYSKRKRQRGTETSQKYVLSHMWTPYKSVAHLVLAMFQIGREALPSELKRLPHAEVDELLWNAEDGDSAGDVLKRLPGVDDFVRALERAEEIRLAAIAHPKVTIEDADTIKFIPKCDAGSKRF